MNMIRQKIITMVRNLPDEGILELVQGQLGAQSFAAASRVAAAAALNGGSTSPAPRTRTRSAKRTPHHFSVKRPSVQRSEQAAKANRGQKRSAEQIAESTTKVQDAIKARGEGGAKSEDLSKALGMPTRTLALVLKKLLWEKSITSTGKARGTRYYAAGLG